MRDPDSEGRASLSLSDEKRVAQLCDQFEAVQKNGQQPRIEDYVVQAPEQAQSRLLEELIALEIDWRHEVGMPLEIESLRQRFPDHLAVIDVACTRADSLRGDLDGTLTTGLFAADDTALETDEDEVPQRIGRYVIEKELGRGGFAVVYLAYDSELDRQVALKVPRRDRFRSNRDIERFVEEARHAARLDHPGIVRVYDVQRDEKSVYIVQQYVPGQDLATGAKHRRFAPREIAELVVGIADAVGFAHQSGLYHRDLKPANILVDENGRPHVADFGLAVHVSQQHRHRGELAGSYPYMAPEQVRGEAHRLDGRTDIWALGIILYELLTGTRPFTGQDESDLIDEIKHRDPRPPRQIDPAIDRELSRICLTCLAKRASERYDAIADMTDDLQRWLQGDLPDSGPGAAARQQPGKPAKIIPKGLRCFDASDADFFLQLLPGPHDRDGLPKSIRFWKQRIEETDPGRAFTVGLSYGPSGCGKTSLVQAGLLPRLASHILPIYVEATANDTEVRLLRNLRRRCPELPQDGSLPDMFQALRDREIVVDKKVLVVLDQFEQWLHAHGSEGDSQLVDALRQCNGTDLQTIVLVRDDFWMAISRFMQQLEIPTVEGQNSAAVDLFDERHARKILQSLGHAYGRFPADTEPTKAQQRFLEQAISELADDGKVICVRLALFADMFKDKPWTPAKLREIGGIGGVQGVGVAFLEETFAAKTAPPEHKVHKDAACDVLAELLPETGTDLKGHMRSREELLSAAGYEHRRGDFDRLLRILDSELRLITPTESEWHDDPSRVGGAQPVASEKTGDSASTAPGTSRNTPPLFYQLTHDYLVPSLREWLTQKKKETRAGRAELLLAERAARWRDKPEKQQLPNPWEYAQITWYTRRTNWKKPEQQMMRAAGVYYGLRTAVCVILLTTLGWASRETYCRVKSAELVKGLATATEGKVLEAVDEIQTYLPWCRNRLRQAADMEAKAPDEIRQQLHARLALVKTDDAFVEDLAESLLTATPEYFGVIRRALQPYARQVAPALWKEFRADGGNNDRRFRSGLALAGYARDSQQWHDEDFGFLSDQLLSENPKDQPEWLTYFEPVSERCVPHWEDKFQRSDLTEIQLGAANALAEFIPADQLRIANLLAIATPKQYHILFPLIADKPEDAMKASLAKRATGLPPDDMSTVDRVSFGQRRAGAGITLLRLGERERVLPTFKMTDDPEAMTQFIHRCRDRKVRPEELLELLRQASSSSLKPKDSSLARYALLLALGEYPITDVPMSDRQLLLDQLAEWYANDPSSGVHGACGWLLRQWGEHERAAQVDQMPVPYSSDREWFTLAIMANSPREAYRPATADSESKPETENADDARASSQDEAGDAVTQEADSATQESVGAAAEDTSKTSAADSPQAEPEGQPGYVPRTLYFTFVVFPPGEYQFGSLEDEPDRIVNEVRHTVTITRPFALLDREVTFADLIAFDPSVFRSSMQDPLVTAEPTDAGTTVSWYQSVAFCRWLTAQAGLSEEDQAYPSPASLAEKEFPREPTPDSDWAPKNWPVRLERRGFRLPTEAEWEVASRAGTRTAYVFGSDASLLKNYAWSLENSRKHVQRAKTRRPGLRGLFDTHGNVWEWGHDWYGDYDAEPVDDPRGPPSGTMRVSRGGGWRYDAANCRSSYRGGAGPTSRGSVLGFRLALVPFSTDAER